MYYLKCSDCGHFNVVKTEYQIFCSNCDKKMDNNYTSWVKRNPDKSFDDFKRIVCTTEVHETRRPKSKSKSGTKMVLKILLGIAVVVGLFFVVGQFAGETLMEYFKKTVYDKSMMVVASEVNKSCPIMIDNATRLDNAIALPNNVFQYNYTLVKLVKDSVNIAELKNYLEPRIINNVKSNPDMKAMRSFKTIMNYYYKDRKGIYLFTISVEPEQYE